MDCPRCGGRLVRYRLGERETVGCQSCEYVGVSVDHTAEQGRPESWDDAIDRFQRQGQSVPRVTREDLPAEVPAAESTEVEEFVERAVEDDRVLPIFDDAEHVEGGAGADRVLPVFENGEVETAPARDEG